MIILKRELGAAHVFELLSISKNISNSQKSVQNPKNPGARPLSSRALLARERRLASQAAANPVPIKKDVLDEKLQQRNRINDLFGIDIVEEERKVSQVSTVAEKKYDPTVTIFSFRRAWQQLTGKLTDFTYGDFRSAHKARNLKPYEHIRYEKFFPDGRVFQFTEAHKDNFYMHFSKYGVENGEPVFRYNTDSEVKSKKQVLREKIARRKIQKASELKEKRKGRSEYMDARRNDKMNGIFSSDLEEKHEETIVEQIALSEKKERRLNELAERRAKAEANEASRIARINRRRAKRNAAKGASLPMVTSVAQALSYKYEDKKTEDYKPTLKLEGKEDSFFANSREFFERARIEEEVHDERKKQFDNMFQLYHTPQLMYSLFRNFLDLFTGEALQVYEVCINSIVFLYYFKTRHTWRNYSILTRTICYGVMISSFYKICDRSFALVDVDIFQVLFDYAERYGKDLFEQLFPKGVNGNFSPPDSVSLKVEGGSTHFEDFVLGLENALDQIESVHEGTLMKSLLNILRLSVFMKFFDKETALNLRSYIGDDSSVLRGLTIPQLGIYALRQILTVVKISSLVTKGYSYNDVLAIGNDRNRLLAEAKFLIQNKENVYFGKRVEGRTSVRHFVTRCRKVISSLEENLRTMSRISVESSKDREVIASLGSIIAELEMTLVSNNRAAPMVIAAVGPPAIGKSTLIDLYSRIPDYYDGIKYDPSHRYSKNAISEYWEKYSPLEHSVVFLSELGRFQQPYVNAHGDATMDEFLTMADSLPYLVNKAAIEGKGTTPFNSSLILIDSNNNTLGLNKNSHYTSVAAYLRRIVRVYPEVKDEFRLPGSCSIDKAKVKPGEILDIYSIRISWTKSSSNTAYEEIFYTNPLNGTDRFSAVESFHFLYNLYCSSREDSNKAVNFMADEEKVMHKLGFVPGVDIKYHDKDHVMPPISSISTMDPYLGSRGSEAVPLNLFDSKEEKEFKLEGDLEAKEIVEKVTFKSVLSSLPIIWNDCYHLFSDVSYFPIRFYSSCYEKGLSKENKDNYSLLEIQIFPLVVLATIWFCWKFFWHALLRRGIILDLLFLILLVSLALKLIWDTLDISKDVCVKEITRVISSEVCIRLKRDLDVKKKNLKELASKIGTKHQMILSAGIIVIPSAMYALSRLFEVEKDKIQNPISKDKEKANFQKKEKDEDIVAEGVVSKEVFTGNFTVSDFDKKIGSSLPTQILPNKLAGLMDQWQVRKTIYDQGVRGQTDKYTLSRIYGNVYKFEVIHNGISSNSRCLALKQDIVMFPTHVLRRFNNYPIKLLIYPIESSDKHKLSSEYIVRKEQIRDLEDDISIVRLPFHATNLMKYLLPADKFPGFCSGFIEGGDLSVISLSKDSVQASGPTGSIITTKKAVFRYNFKDHRVGMCGTPIVGKNVTGLFIIGKHFCGDTNSSLCFGNTIDKSEVEQAILDLEKSSAYVRLSEGELQINTYPPISQSMFNYEFLPQAIYYGYDGKVIAPSKISKVCENKMLNLSGIHSVIDKCGKATKTFGPPLMWRRKGDEYINPYNINVVGICAERKTVDQVLIDRIVSEITNRFLTSLKKEGISRLEPWVIDVAVNGHPDDRDIRGLNMSTSSGYGFQSPKSREFPVGDNGRRNPSISVMNGVKRILDSYEKDEMAMPIFTGTLKDEAISKKKIESGKTRLFCFSSVDFLLVCKVFLGPFFTLMLKFPEIFCTGIGMDCHRESHTMAERLRGFSDKYLAGDYGKYDQSMPLQVAVATSEIIMRCLTAFGYTEYQLMICRGLLSDLNSPLLNVLGDLFVVPGYQPSGCLGTAETNSIRNLILQMYVYYRLAPNSDFFSNNLSYTYGDDMVIATRNPVMTNVNFHKIITQEVGMDYTSIDKGVITREFDTFEDLMWLKRKFRWSESRSRYVLCIDPDSMHRMVTWFIPSTECTPQDQSFGILDSLSREMFFFYEESSDYHLARLEIIATLVGKGWDEKILKKRLPSWSDIFKSLYDEKADDNGLTAERNHSLLDEHQIPVMELQGQERFIQFRRRLVAPDYSTTFRVEEKVGPSINVRAESIKKILPGSLNKCFRSERYFTSSHFRKDVDFYFASLLPFKLVLEGDVTQVSRDGNPSHIFKTQNIQDSTGDEANFVRTHEINNARVLTRSNLSLDKFFSRPLELATIPLILGVNIDTYIDPWNTYVLNPAVRAKLRNYAYLKGNLKVRAIISGTPFHSGKVLISYLPYPLSNPVRETYRAIGPTESPYETNFSKYLSQQYGSVVLDVRSNKPTDIDIPFISPQPVARLFNESNVPGDVYDDLSFTGFLYVNNLTTLTSVSASPSTNLTLYIYAWMENVELGTNTATLVNLMTEGDERRVGPLETLSGIGKRISDALTVIPEIEPFAKASSIILGGLQSVSAYFGWSYPILVEQPMRVKNVALQNGMNVIGTDTGFSLTMDPLQELSVDPRFLGVSKDELTIAHLCSIPSLVDSFDWSPAVEPLGMPIWRFPICPCVNVPDALSNVQPTALSFAVQPFRWWHGNLTFTLHIAGSDFHRGRFMIYYEPNISQKSLIDTNLDMNKQYIMTVDLQSAQTVEFCVNWSQPRPWLRVPNVEKGVDLYNQLQGTITDAAEYCNGYIGITPLSELQSPNSSPVEVVVYVKSDDMRVNVMSLIHLPTNRLLVPPEMKLEGDLRPFEGDLKCMELNETFGDDGDMVSNYFGELPISFRAMLKRFENSRIGTVTSSVTGDSVMRIRTSLYPRIVPAMGQVSTTLPLSRNLISYLRLAFLGIRGGYRYRFFSTAPNAGNNVAPTNAEIRGSTSDPPTDDAFVMAATSALDLFNNNMGRVSYIPRTNGGIEYCVPFYSNNLFGWSARDNFLDDSASTMMDSHGVKEHQVQSVFKGTPETIWYMLESAAGEDFMLTRWVGAAPYNIGTPV